MKAVNQSRPSPLPDQIVITGLGAVCSLGNSVREICLGLTSGKSGFREIVGLDAGGFGCLAAQVKNLPALKTDIHPQLARSMGTHLSLLLISMEEALGNAAIAPDMFDPGDFGFFAGMGMVDYHIEDLLSSVLKSLSHNGDLDYDRFFSTGYQEIYPLWPLGMLNNVAFCQAAIHFGLQGENCVFSPHGDAGIQAVAEAVKVLGEGKAKVALAGGVGEEVSPLSLARAKLKGLIGPPEIGWGAKSAKCTPPGLGSENVGRCLCWNRCQGPLKEGRTSWPGSSGSGFHATGMIRTVSLPGRPYARQCREPFLRPRFARIKSIWLCWEVTVKTRSRLSERYSAWRGKRRLRSPARLRWAKCLQPGPSLIRQLD